MHQHAPRVLCEPEPSFDVPREKSDSQTPPDTPVEPPSLQRTQSEPGEDFDEEEEEVTAVPDNQTLLRMLEEQEKISHMFRCARIQGLDTCEGLLLFGKEHCYVIDGFTLLKNREIRDIDSIPLGSYDPIFPNSGSPRR